MLASPLTPTRLLLTYSLLFSPARYDESTSRKKALEDELSDLEGKLARAEKLVTGLAGELWEGRWADTRPPRQTWNIVNVITLS